MNWLERWCPLSGPDSVHGIIPEALVKYERDPNYTSTSTSASANGNDGKNLAVPEEAATARPRSCVTCTRVST